MYNKPVFQSQQLHEAHDLINAVRFGTVISHSDVGLLATHLPFMLAVTPEHGPYGTLFSHIAAENLQSAAIMADNELLVTFLGTHGYVSASWYPQRDTAPTWNYATVHAYGKATIRTTAETARDVATLVQQMEHGRPNEWLLRDLGPGGMQRRLPRIVGFAIVITRLEAKFKMGQDERLGDTNAAITQLEADHDEALAAMMRTRNQHRTDDEQ